MGSRLVVGCLWLCGCSLFLGDDTPDPGADASSKTDAATRDAGTPITPLVCAREVQLADSFDDNQIDTGLWSVTMDNATVTETGGALEVFLFNVTQTTRGAVDSTNIFDLTAGELTADISAVTFTADTDGLLTLAALDAMDGELARLEVGQLGELGTRFGFRFTNGGSPVVEEIAPPAPPATGGFNGRWRLRSSNQVVLVEARLNDTTEFAKVGEVSVGPAVSRIRARLEAVGRDPGAALTFDFAGAELSTAAGGSWCSIEQVSYLPSRGDTPELFTSRTEGNAQIAPLEGRLTATNGKALLQSTARYDLADSVVVFALEAVETAGNGVVTLELRRSADERVAFEISGEQIVAYTPTRSTSQDFSISEHAFLRIGHQDGAVDFDVSADGDSFSNIMTEPVDFPVGDVEIRLSAESTDAAILRISSIRGDAP